MKQGIIFILLLGLGFIGCQKDTQTNASIVGDWQRNIVVDNGYSIPVELSFNEDGTAGAMIGDSDDGNEIFGTYSINDGIITVLDEDCGLENEGNYSYTVSNTELTLTFINDECEDCEVGSRPHFISNCSTAVWTRVD